jgi:hypothetical protein
LSTNGPAQARATIVKPPDPVPWSRISTSARSSSGATATVTMDQAGALTCTAATLVCAGSGTPGRIHRNRHQQPRRSEINACNSRSQTAPTR